MKKKEIKRLNKVIITEVILLFVTVAFKGTINYLMTYFSKKAQLASSAMEKHEISRMEIELINNVQNIGSTAIIFGNIIILAIMISILIKYLCKKQIGSEK